MSRLTQVREAAEADLLIFAKLVGPNRLYGQVHEEAIRWLTENNSTYDDLLLLPRGHLKSHLIAVWCAWWITKHPEVTILYVSATEDLAIEQLYAIKSILESDIYYRYWPEHVNKEESKREEWSARNIKIDHPLRKQLGVRDRTVAARSVGSNTTGLHCDVLVFDDIVVPDNAYTQEGRQKVAASYSQFSSIANPGAITKVVGTRYHGKDIYATLIDMEYEVYNEAGEVVGKRKSFRTFTREVEENNVFLWPREQHPKSKKWYGFNPTELAKIRSKYFSMGERAQYYAQYYNNPNSPDEDRVDAGQFQYYDQRHLTLQNGVWYYNGEELAIACAGDLAYTTGNKSDFTAYAVVGRTAKGFVYILDMLQFKTDKYDVYYSNLLSLHSKWMFRKVRIESNAGANVIVNEIKDRARAGGVHLAIEGKASRAEKHERVAAILEPLYDSASIFHPRGGFVSVYEEQVLLARPAHDDLKDAVSAAIEICPKPAGRNTTSRYGADIISHPRFGGRMRG